MNFWLCQKGSFQWLLVVATSFWQCPSTQLIHLKGLSGCRLWQSLRLSSVRAGAWIYGKGTKGEEKTKMIDLKRRWRYTSHCMPCLGVQTWLANTALCWKWTAAHWGFKKLLLYLQLWMRMKGLFQEQYILVTRLEFNPHYFTSVTMGSISFKFTSTQTATVQVEETFLKDSCSVLCKLSDW